MALLITTKVKVHMVVVNGPFHDHITYWIEINNAFNEFIPLMLHAAGKGGTNLYHFMCCWVT